MKIYTKTGDKGLTKLVGGIKVSKDSDRVEAYGTLDELNSWVGYTASLLVDEEIKAELEKIQNILFDIGTDLATTESLGRLEKMNPDDIQWLESRIDFYTQKSPDIERFILPGGTSTASAVHVARTVSRRAERMMVRLNWTSKINENLLVFVNRLSDYFYALARYINFKSNVADVFYERGEKVFHKIKEDGV